MKLTILTAILASVFLSVPSLVLASEAGLIAQASSGDGEYSPVQFYGYAEYGMETNTGEGALGANYGLMDDVTLYGEINFIKEDSENVDFDTFNFGIDYSWNYNIGTYIELEFDNDFDYNDITVGVSFVY